MLAKRGKEESKKVRNLGHLRSAGRQVKVEKTEILREKDGKKLKTVSQRKLSGSLADKQEFVLAGS